ncbi:MAG: energy-coupled thiamine transporter ThiT [Pyramidobacter sp.]|nr:energy-coupled thiamine transporter ThiT [Pyramidobacter sp.]
MNSKTRYLAEAALTVALTLVLSEVKIFRMPQGGSVTLENVPLIIMAMRWGLARGMAAGAVSGLLQFLIGGYMVHPVQMLLDYPAAYALLALAAFFPRRTSWGVLAASAARMACHVASGVIFFASYAPEGTHPLVYSLMYNGGYMTVNTVLALIIVPLVLPRLRRI